MSRLNGRLSGRVAKLERLAGPPHAERHCPACGLEHAPAELSIALIRAIIGPPSIPAPPERPPRRTEPFCACDCCGEGGHKLNGMIRGDWGAA